MTLEHRVFKRAKANTLSVSEKTENIKYDK